MTWQQHKLDMTEREMRLVALSQQLEAEGLIQLEEAKARAQDSASSDAMDEGELERRLELAQQRLKRSSRTGAPLLVAHSADELGNIEAAEMISPDDPRGAPPRAE
ncbi:hypothetical protein [Amycolatopsis sp. WAC 04182]|uniref:hypothetical protein n=1 Tax=Amycolatopsis sp. WAC 04182 TaxID=2203198 RepID=UPI000F7B7769|nr:hypothetical protein [Amycolatopsis sp. WAC 04182]